VYLFGFNRQLTVSILAISAILAIFPIRVYPRQSAVSVAKP
jgi:hypothetical protein